MRTRPSAKVLEAVTFMVDRTGKANVDHIDIWPDQWKPSHWGQLEGLMYSAGPSRWPDQWPSDGRSLDAHAIQSCRFAPAVPAGRRPDPHGDRRIAFRA